MPLAISPADREEAIAYFIAVCADYFCLHTNVLLSPCRTKQVSMARHVSMFVARRLFGLTLQETASVFNRKCHGTVIAAIENVHSCKHHQHHAKALAERIRNAVACQN